MQFVDFPTPNHVRTSFTRQAAFFALTSIALTAGTANAQSGTQTGRGAIATYRAYFDYGTRRSTMARVECGTEKYSATTCWHLEFTDAERKSKWLAMAQNYLGLAPAEQAKLQSRMAEWAALNPQERERARLNFAETKKLSPVTTALRNGRPTRH
jgi:hypothetical protein